MPHSAAKKFFKKRRKQNVAHPQNGILLSYEKEEQTHAPTWMTRIVHILGPKKVSVN